MLDNPQVNIFAICDRVIRDQVGKPSLLGVFDVFNFSKFPASYQFFLFTQISAPRGDYLIAVHLSREEGLQKKIFEERIRINENPGIGHVCANLTITYDEPGLYDFRLYIDDMPRLICPFHVRQIT